MKFFNRKEKVLDLGERYQKDQERVDRLKENISEKSKSPSTSNSSSSGGILNFFGNMNSSANSTPDFPSTEVDDVTERKKKLAKKLMDLTTSVENLNNQIYHLQQRVEVLEKKTDIKSY